MDDPKTVSDLLAWLAPAIEWLVDLLGPAGALILIGMLLMAGFAWRWWGDHRLTAGYREALAEKEKTIQRLANDNRELRIALFKTALQWSEEEIRLYVLENVPKDGAESRRQLEGGQVPKESPATPIPTTDMVTAKPPRKDGTPAGRRRKP